jgi:hypothetical protein
MNEEMKKGKPLKEKKADEIKKSYRKTELIQVRMTPAEKLITSGKAKKAGLTLSEWFRQSAKNGHVNQRLSQSDLGHLKMLISLTNDLSLVAHLAQIKGIIFLEEQCKSLISAVAKIINKLFANVREGGMS